MFCPFLVNRWLPQNKCLDESKPDADNAPKLPDAHRRETLEVVGLDVSIAAVGIACPCCVRTIV
jgi:hypothetical protein